ncbi:MAG: hypothetical protein HN377_00190 [Alphaproteobacteria bacterium]|jgi:hypothetical protein|nr:hypothetical protein [Alphaproteobacteria bacterium]
MASPNKNPCKLVRTHPDPEAPAEGGWVSAEDLLLFHQFGEVALAVQSGTISEADGGKFLVMHLEKAQG